MCLLLSAKVIKQITHFFMLLQLQDALEADSLMTEEYASSKIDDEDLNSVMDNSDNQLWMTSTQFSHLLDKQEAAETKFEKNVRPPSNRFSTSSMISGYGGYSQQHSALSAARPSLFRRSSIASSVTSGSSSYSRQNNNHLVTPDQSFLDNEARVPFAKLKQVR